MLRLVERGLVSEPLLESWLEGIAAPFRERGGGEFDVSLYAAQRNARNLLFTLHTRLSVMESLSPAQEAALATLTQALRG